MLKDLGLYHDNCMVLNTDMVFRCSVVEALEAASLHPAEALGIQHSKVKLTFEIIPLFNIINYFACFKHNHNVLTSKFMNIHAVSNRVV